MKKVIMMVLATLTLAGAMGCSYTGVAGSGTDKVVIAKNGFGSNSVYVCKVTDSGLTACSEAESP
ncbi:MAG TPA: hypothetical protein VNO21_16625 [Polyangiaceae bacterium]|nr:hypothetical protein [Polyangiaceae bacterium]